MSAYHPCRPAGTVDATSASEMRRSSVERPTRAQTGRSFWVDARPADHPKRTKAEDAKRQIISTRTGYRVFAIPWRHIFSHIARSRPPSSREEAVPEQEGGSGRHRKVVGLIEPEHEERLDEEAALQGIDAEQSREPVGLPHRRGRLFGRRLDDADAKVLVPNLACDGAKSPDYSFASPLVRTAALRPRQPCPPLSWWRSVRISTSSEALDRNSAIITDQISLTKSAIGGCIVRFASERLEFAVGTGR